MKLLQAGIIWREDVKVESCVVIPCGKTGFMCCSAIEVIQQETSSDNETRSSSLSYGNIEKVSTFQWFVSGSDPDPIRKWQFVVDHCCPKTSYLADTLLLVFLHFT